jgi:hypothetical protein
MKIIFLASESMGTRSMATYLKTEEVSILLDPGVALAPIRGGYTPHKIEIEKLGEHWRRIKERAKRSDILIITHYHYDHLNPQEPEIYRSKKVLLKNPERFINPNQRRRALKFIESIRNMAKSIKYADGRQFKIGRTKIRFSPPLFHGFNDRSGYVLSVLIEDGRDKFLFTSDIQGPVTENQLKFILENKPDFLYLDGPSTYMLGRGYPDKFFKLSIGNLLTIIERGFVKYLIVDHHLLRETDWMKRIHSLFRKAKGRGIKILNAAEFMGEEVLILEARRRKLYCDSKDGAL